jgi:hypothetical protein
MNKILKLILLGAEQTARLAVPGAAAVDDAARAILKARGTPGKSDDVEAIFQTGVASLRLIEGFGGHFADDAQFEAGMYQAKAGFTLMSAAIRAHAHDTR